MLDKAWCSVDLKSAADRACEADVAAKQCVALFPRCRVADGTAGREANVRGGLVGRQNDGAECRVDRADHVIEEYGDAGGRCPGDAEGAADAIGDGRVQLRNWHSGNGERGSSVVAPQGGRHNRSPSSEIFAAPNRQASCVVISMACANAVRSRSALKCVPHWSGSTQREIPPDAPHGPGHLDQSLFSFGGCAILLL